MNLTGAFYNSDSELSLPCEIVLKGSELYIYTKHAENSLIIWNTKNTKVLRQESNSIHISGGNQHELSVLCGGPEIHAFYQAITGAQILNKCNVKKSINWFYSGLVILIALTVSVFLLIYFMVFPKLSEATVHLIPKSYETELGEKLSNMYLSNSYRLDSADFYAQQFLSELKVKSDIQLTLHVLPAPEINAFALPGGHIFIYSGLLTKINKSEELVALLGHEITHVTERHALKSMFRKAAAGMLIMAVIGDVASLSSWIISEANTFTELNYSRDLETEADVKGLALMEQSQVNPSGMVSLLEILKNENTNQPSLMKYLSTHPDIEMRLQKARISLKAENNYKSPPALETALEGIKRHIQASAN
jgi:beta-barrel assembly-enhancing protease